MVNKSFIYFIYSLIIVLFVFWSCTSSPRYTSLKTEYGVSSYYGYNDGFHGKRTANGEIFNQHALSAAHKTLPLNTIVRVTNLSNNKSLILRINDRGPYIKGRILDCSYGAAKKLGFIAQGTTKVRIELIEVGDNKYMKHKSGS
ncbi:MAG: septal ring lytic transglycosylase RlpA family lipoprotein [Candidatus Marinimicrobia bacterium]|nr:septal ring lytic transglycosylase RlpA family lipoprotein [Candidatus Neomarinimicrobiota bacterium]